MKGQIVEWLVILLIVCSPLLWGGRGIFASEDVAIRTLTAQGYSEIKIVKHAWFLIGFRGCDMNDAARFTARAINPAGLPTEIYV